MFMKFDLGKLDLDAKLRNVSWRILPSPWLTDASIFDAALNSDFLPEMFLPGRHESSKIDLTDFFYVDIYLDNSAILNRNFYDLVANIFLNSRDGAIYSDYLMSESSGKNSHIKLPKFSFERFLANDYLGPVVAFASIERPPDIPMSRSELLHKNASNIFRIPTPTYVTISSKPSTKLKNEHINRVSDFIYQNRLDAICVPNFEEGSLDISYARMATGTVSIVIPTRGSSLEAAPLSMVESCVKSTLMQDRSGLTLEIVLVVDTDTNLEYVNRISQAFPSDVVLKVVNFDPPFNFSKKCNDGFKVTSGQTIVYLNDDTEWIGHEGLKELVATANLPNVGVAGALLVYPDGYVQHAGQTMRPPDILHAYRYQLPFNGQFGDLVVAHEASGVTGACMALKRDVVNEIQGWSEDFPNSFNDVDLCFKIRDKGFSVIQANKVKLVHHESKTRVVEVYTSHHRDLKKKWSYFLNNEDFMRNEFAIGRVENALNEIGQNKADLSGKYVRYFFYLVKNYGLKGVIHSSLGVLHKATRHSGDSKNLLNL
jgi:GT2 family glycosyltransferase